MKRWLIILLLGIIGLYPLSLRAVGHAGHSLQFPGSTTGNMVLVPNNALLNINTRYTIEAWIKFDAATVTGTPRILDRQGFFAFYLGPGGSYGAFRLWFTVYPAPSGSPSVSIASSITTSNLNSWHHVAVAVEPYDATRYRAQLYIDGVQAATSDHAAYGLLNPAYTNKDLRMGTSYINTNPWPGQIEDVRIWTVRRSASNIRSARGTPLSGTEDGLLAYWNLNDGSGSIATDSSPNHLDGTVSGNVSWVESTAPIGYNLINPNSGVYTWGSPINVMWSVNPEITNIDLHQSSDDGATWQLIAANLSNPKNVIGTFSTIIPLIETTQAKYRVSKAGDASQFDTNDAPITWTGAGFVPTVYELEAESATLNHHMFVGIDGLAFDCQFIYSSRNAGNDEGTGLLTFDVAAPGATFYLWARMLGQGDTRNSVFVSMDGGTEYILSVPAHNRWIWVQLKADEDNPVPFPLTPGHHTLTLRGREHYARIDRIVLTNDPRPNYIGPFPDKWIKITQPNADYEKVELIRNSLYEIKWNTFNIGGKVNIEISLDGGATFLTIDENVDNTGSYLWRVNDVLTNDAIVRISETLGTCPMDQSWSSFSIVNPPPEIHLIAPNGGETLIAKDTTTISWSNYYFDGNVSIFYTYDNGANWTEIASDIPNVGFFRWVVPKTISEACLVKVKSASHGTPLDISDSLFTIIRPADEAPAMWLLSPNGGEQFEVGQEETINWNSEYLNTTVTIFFSADSGATWSVVAENQPPVGSYQWTIPNSPSSKCLIKVAESQTGLPSDISEATFTINALPVNYALLFDGIDDFVQIPHHTSLNVSQSFTIEFWMQTDRLAQSWCRLLEKGTFDEYAIAFYGNTGRISGSMRTAIPGASRWSTVFGPSLSILMPRVWTHVAVTYDGSIAKLYINGLLETTMEAKAAPRKLVGDLILGGALHGTVYEYHYRGLIDELRIWRVPRTAAEIADNMFKRVKPNNYSLVAYYTFDDGSGQILTDCSPLANHGRLGKTEATDASDPVWFACDRPTAPAALVALQRSEPTLAELAEMEPVPDEWALAQNYPNPFNATTTIVYSIPLSAAGTQMSIDIFDVQGRLIKTLYNGPAEPGRHSVIWDGRDHQEQLVASGLYFYRLQAGSFSQVKRLVMLK